MANLKKIQATAKANDDPCFVAGTLIHTKEGLVPIEQIKVGDWVLSQPEGKGELSYKQVTQTFVHENTEHICLVEFIHSVQKDGESEYLGKDWIAVTWNHPFFTQDKGWVRACDLSATQKVELENGGYAWVGLVNRIYQTETQNVGWAPRDKRDMRGWGDRVDFATDGIRVENLDYAPETAWDFEFSLIARTVYNFEVQDNHTYYVGKMGLWAHNKGVLTEKEALLINGSQQGRKFFKMEPISKNPDGSYEEITDELEAALPSYVEIPGGGKDGADVRAALAVEYTSPWKKANFETYDGLAEMPNGNKSTLLLDVKHDKTIYVKAFEKNATIVDATAAKDKLALKLAEVSENIRQSRAAGDPDMAALWIVGDKTGNAGDEFLTFVKEFVETELLTKNRSTIAGVYNETWFSEYFYFGKCKAFTPDTTMALPDTVWRYKYSTGVFEEVPIGSVLKEAKQADVQKLFDGLHGYINAAKTPTKNLDVAIAGPNSSATTLMPDDIQKLLSSAKQYWLNTGALPSVLDNVQISVGQLASGVAAQTQSNKITLSADGAGWGWFVDSTPQESSEFTLQNCGELLAPTESGANGKLDLLSVLIHELGHSLGLEHAAVGTMEGLVQPGERRLPADLEAAFMRNLREAVSAKPRTSLDSQALLATQYQVAANPTLTDPKLQTGTGWTTDGNVAIGSGAAILSESATQQTRLNQVFIVGEHDRYLTFTLDGIDLDPSTSSGQSERLAPDDAFEAALLDANAGTSLLSGTGLTHNDAFLNLQANGTEYAGQGIISTRNADGSRTYRVDLSGIPAGTAVNLGFDLIGFGAANSHVTVRDIRLGVPEAHDDTATTAEDTPLSIAALANDIDADQPGFVPVIVAAPTHGALTLGADGSFNYVPATNYFGADSFTYALKEVPLGDKLSDGAVDSNLASVAILVTPVNDAPVVTAPSATTAEDMPLILDLLAQASDVEGSPLTPLIVTGPQHGTLAQNADQTFTYTPEANFNGADSFTYKVNDGELDSSVVSVDIVVTAVNDAPVIASRSVTLDEDTQTTVDLLQGASDVDAPKEAPLGGGDTLSVAITAAPQHGSLTQNADGTWTYAPEANWNGTDSVAYEVSDGIASTPTILTFVVNGVNDAPLLGNQALAGNEDSALTGNLLATATDLENSPLTPAIIAGPQHGTLALNGDGTFTYTPEANFNGADSFSYRVNDGELDSGIATVSLTKNPRAQRRIYFDKNNASLNCPGFSRRSVAA